MNGLTPKQQLFVDEYLKDRNGTQAAIRAGYSEKTANEQAARLLANVSVSEVVQKEIAASQKKAKLSREKVLDELSKGAFAELDISELKFSDKIKCLELLCKAMGLLDGVDTSRADTESAVARLQANVKRYVARQRTKPRGDSD